MQAWSETTNLNLATALATCGVDFNHEQMLDEASGRVVAKFFLALKSRDGTISTPGLVKRVRSGQLEREEPAHPVLDCLHGLNTREKLLNWLHKGERCQIAPLVACGRAVTIDGTESTLPVGELVATPDIKLACALMRCGFPCVGIDGEGMTRRFLVRNQCAAGGPVTASEIAKGIRDGTLAATDPEHPALWVMMALRNRDNILSLVKRGVKLILLRNPKSADWQRYCRSAVIFENSAPKALDRVQRHLRIP